MRVLANRRWAGKRSAVAAAAGFSILEMMVAMTVSLFIIGALAAIVLGSASTGRTRERATELQVNGRYALEQMKVELMHAGYLGISSLFFPDAPLPFGVTNACDTAAIGLMSQRVWASNDANPYSATCIPAANYARGDVLVIRYLSPTAVTSFSDGFAYYRSAYEGGQPFTGTTPPDFTGSNKTPPYLDYRIEETVYYVSPFTTASTDNPPVPALYRLRLGSGPAMIPELVASGVENMQVRFGLFQTNDSVRYVSPEEISSADDWDLIRSVQVWLLMRASTAEADFVNNSTYTMGSQNITVNDAYRRLLFSTTVQLRN